MSAATPELFDRLDEGIVLPSKPKQRAAKKPRPKTKSALANELAMALIAALRSQRAGNPPALLTLRELAATVGTPTTAEIKAAVATKVFKGEALLPKPPSKTFAIEKALDLPVALRDDLDRLAAEARVLLAALAAKRKDGKTKVHALGVSELKAWLSGKPLKDSFDKAVNRQIDAGLLPAGIGWLHINKPKLFSVDDLHLQAKSASDVAAARVDSSRPRESDIRPVPQVQPSIAAPGFAAKFDEAFAHLDRQNGSYNFVWLSELRHALSQFDRDRFDAGLKELRRSRRYQINAGEARSGITNEQQAAAILEDGTLHTSVSRVQR